MRTELLRHRRVDCLRWIQPAQDDNENLWSGTCEYGGNIEYAQTHTKRSYFRTERSTESTDDATIWIHNFFCDNFYTGNFVDFS